MHFTTATVFSILSSVTAQTYKSTFTQYGGGDVRSSSNCNTATAACGFYNYPGFNAAASQNLFGVGPGAGAGPGCGTCWQLTPQLMDDAKTAIAGASSIVVQVNNLCPADGNILCSQSDLSGKSVNQYNAVVNFDLCIDDGAAARFFGSSGTSLAIGTATSVSCNQWVGSAPFSSGSNPAIGAPAAPPPARASSAAPLPASSSAPASSAAAVSSSAPATSVALENSAFSMPLPTTLATTASESLITHPAAPVVATQTMYGQCGGASWAGATACGAVATCSTVNSWYAQCTPA